MSKRFRPGSLPEWILCIAAVIALIPTSVYAFYYVRTYYRQNGQPVGPNMNIPWLGLFLLLADIGIIVAIVWLSKRRAPQAQPPLVPESLPEPKLKFRIVDAVAGPSPFGKVPMNALGAEIYLHLHLINKAEPPIILRAGEWRLHLKSEGTITFTAHGQNIVPNMEFERRDDHWYPGSRARNSITI
jgi:hypothetical protein